MTKPKKIIAWIIVGISIVGLLIALTHRRQPVVLRGSVLRQDVDPNKQLALADEEITAINGLGSAKSKSDTSGFFSLKLPKGLRRRQPVLLQFRRKDYQPLDWNDFISDKVYVAPMIPINQDTTGESRSQS